MAEHMTPVVAKVLPEEKAAFAAATQLVGTTPSNALYYELEGGQWLCVRPSSTEPKIKIYAGVCAQDAVAAQRQIQEALSAARRALGMEG